MACLPTGRQFGLSENDQKSEICLQSILAAVPTVRRYSLAEVWFLLTGIQGNMAKKRKTMYTNTMAMKKPMYNRFMALVVANTR